MSVRMRHTKGHTHNRRSHHALSAVKALASEKEGAYRLPHRVDEATGIYRGREIAPATKTAADKPTKAQKHDHPHGTHHEHEGHEHVHEAKPAEAIAVSHQARSAEKPHSRSGMGVRGK